MEMLVSIGDKAVLSNYVHLHSFVPSVHKTIQTLSTHAEMGVGEHELSHYIAFHEEVKIYPVCNSRFPISLHEITIA